MNDEAARRQAMAAGKNSRADDLDEMPDDLDEMIAEISADPESRGRFEAALARNEPGCPSSFCPHLEHHDGCDGAMSAPQVKQVIVIRRDLRMRRGKEIAQGAHAAMAWLTSRLRSPDEGDDREQWVFPAYLSLAEVTWLKGLFTKVTCQVDNLEELLAVGRAAEEAGIQCHVITDAGRTEFGGEPTVTCLAIGPAWSDEIDRITGHLKLYL